MMKDVGGSLFLSIMNSKGLYHGGFSHAEVPSHDSPVPNRKY